MNRRYKYFERNVVPQLLYTLNEDYSNQIENELIYKSNDFEYKYLTEYCKFPEELWGSVISGVATDKDDNIYCTVRNIDNPIVKFDKDGKYLKSIGKGIPIGKLHGITVNNDYSIMVTDDTKHVAYKLDENGKVLFQIGELDNPSDSGYRTDYIDPSDTSKPIILKVYDKAGNLVEKTISNSAYMSIDKRALPFNKPTRLLEHKDRLYASDGYGNCAIHIFDLNGKLIKSFGEPGDKDGEFRTVHSLNIDKLDRIWVADRDNERIQVFDLDGNHIKTIDDLWYPVDVTHDDKNIYVLQNDGLISIYDYDFNLLAEIGHWQCGNLVAHAFTLDSKGNILMADCGVKGIFKLERRKK